MTQQTYPCVIAAIPDDGMYLVAVDQDWGRILNRDQQKYWPTGLIGTHLVMTGPWEFLAPMLSHLLTSREQSKPSSRIVGSNSG